MSIRRHAAVMACVRAGIGAASIGAPSLSARLVGYPAAHDNRTARTMARFFGVRELLLAWLVLDALRQPSGPTPSVFAVQAAVDAADVGVQVWPVLNGEGLDRGGVGGMALAAGASVLWARLARQAALGRKLGDSGRSGVRTLR